MARLYSTAAGRKHHDTQRERYGNPPFHACKDKKRTRITRIFTENASMESGKRNTNHTDFHGKIYPCLSVQSVFGNKNYLCLSVKSVFHKKHFSVRRFRYTTPVKPMKAMARMPAVMRAMGVPFMPFGASISSMCSRMPAKMTNAKAKPKAMPTA